MQDINDAFFVSSKNKLIIFYYRYSMKVECCPTNFC